MECKLFTGLVIMQKAQPLKVRECFFFIDVKEIHVHVNIIGS
jgi:hypothetical protein